MFMLWSSHFLAGASAGLFIAERLAHGDLKAAAFSAGVAGLAALLPDLDSPYSKLGRAVPVISWPLKFTAGHRGFFHSLAGCALLCAGVLFALRFWRPLELSLALYVVMAGLLSHLAFDSLSGRCPWLWPLGAGIGVGIVKTRGILEKVVVIPALLVLFGWSVRPAVIELVGIIKNILIGGD